MKLLVRFIQLLLVVTPLAVFGWLCVQNFVPSGIFLVQHSVHDTSPFIDGLLTSARVKPPVKDAQGNWTQTIFADPVFFFVHPHRTFDTIDATVTFKNIGTPIIELGALAAKDPERYILEPLQNLLIDDSKWNRLVDGGTILLQRNSTFKSVADFYAHPPSVSEIATYHTDLNIPFRLPNYLPTTKSQSIDVSLRGTHSIKTYVKNESLHFSFSYMDMNRDAGADPVVISVFDENGQSVGEVRADDDGNISTNAFPSKIKTLSVDIPNLPEGVYKVDLNVDRDIFFRTISTTQQKIIFLNGVYLGDEVAYHETFSPVLFFTEAKRLSFQTRHATGIQNVKVGTQTAVIDTPYKLVTTTLLDSGLTSTTVTKGDLEIVTDAPIAFTQAQYFRPDPVRLLPHTDLDRLGVNYLIANYETPDVQNGWTVATIHLNAHDLLLDNGSWKFAFSTPEIAELRKTVLIKSIDLKLTRPPFSWRDLFGVIKKE